MRAQSNGGVLVVRRSFAELSQSGQRDMPVLTEHAEEQSMDKSDEGYSLEQHVEGQSRRLDAPELGLDLARELEDYGGERPSDQGLRRQDTGEAHGYCAWC